MKGNRILEKVFTSKEGGKRNAMGKARMRTAEQLKRWKNAKTERYEPRQLRNAITIITMKAGPP